MVLLLFSVFSLRVHPLWSLRNMPGKSPVLGPLQYRFFKKKKKNVLGTPKSKINISRHSCIHLENTQEENLVEWRHGATMQSWNESPAYVKIKGKLKRQKTYKINLEATKHRNKTNTWLNMEKQKGGYNQQGNPNSKNRGQQRSNKKAILTNSGNFWIKWNLNICSEKQRNVSCCRSKAGMSSMLILCPYV